MGGPGSGPKKGQRRNKYAKSFRDAAGYEEDLQPLIFPRDIIAQHLVLDENDKKYNEKVVTYILDEMSNGASVVAVMDALGIHERTYYRWMETRPDFKTLVTIAEGMMAVRADKQLIHLGIDLNNPVALVMWLNAHGKRYGYGRQDVRIDHNIHLDGAVDVNHILRDPKLIALENELEARRQQIEDGIIDGDFRELPPHEEIGA
jgi:hypothetical protein